MAIYAEVFIFAKVYYASHCLYIQNPTDFFYTDKTCEGDPQPL